MKQNKIPRNEYIIKPKGKIDPYKDDVQYGDLGQLRYPYQVTKIPGDTMSTEGYGNIPLWTVPDVGPPRMVYPNTGNQFFAGANNFTEYPMKSPMARYGGGLPKAQNGRAQTPEEWEKQIRAVENKIGDPKKWSQENYQELQDKLNEYKAWRENTPEGRAVVDYHNEPNEYVVFPPAHLNKEKYNMKRALELGYQPDETGHWPSVDYESGEYLKSKKHPTAWMEYLYGYTLNPEQAANYNVRVNPEGYFGDDQLQYVPKKPFGGIHTKTDTHMATGGWLDAYDEGGIAEELPIEETVIDPLVGTPTTKPLSKKQEYQNAIKNNYSNYIESVHNITPFDKLTREGHMNCIHGVCTVIEGTKAKKFNQNYTGNMTFADNAKKEGYYKVDPNKEGFEIGDVIQYAQTKEDALGDRFNPKSLNPVNAKELVPQHAKIILDKYVDSDGITRYKVGHNGGSEDWQISTDPHDGRDLSETSLLEHFNKGFRQYDGIIVNRYDPDYVQKKEEDDKVETEAIKGKNQYASAYKNPPELDIKKETYDSYGKPIKTEYTEAKPLIDFYKKNYQKIGKSADMPPEILNKLFYNQIGIAAQETEFDNPLTKRAIGKALVPDWALTGARKVADMMKKDFNWVDHYWEKNADGVQGKYNNVDEFKKHLGEGSKLSPEGREYLYYNSPKSKGMFQQKELSKRGRILNSNFDTPENQFVSSMYLAIDNYHLLKKKYPDLSNDQLVDLTTLMHNAPSKALTPEFVNYYLKNNDVQYVNDVKSKRGVINQPDNLVKKIQKIQNEKIVNKLSSQEKASVMDWAKNLSKKQYGGWLDEYQTGGDNENSVINMLSKNTLAKGERSNQDNTRVSNLPIKTLQALQQQANVEKAAKQQYKQQPVISQGRKLNPSEQAYSDKVQARIANPSNDLGIIAANMASALTRFRYLNPEEIAATTNNPSATVGLASNIMTEALANEMAGPAFGEALSSSSKAIKASKESGLLSNAYKLNPWAFKPKEGYVYRGIGENGLKDVTKSGTFKSPTGSDKTYWADANEFQYAKNHSKPTIEVEPPTWEGNSLVGGHYKRSKSIIAEYPKNQDLFHPEYKWGIKDALYSKANLPISEGKIYKEHWLKGYKEVPVELPGSPNGLQNTYIHPTGKMEGIGDIKDIKRSLMREDQYLKPSEYNSKAIPFSSYKPQAGGYTDVPEFNQELNNMLTKLQYGKRPLAKSVKTNPTTSKNALMESLDNSRYEEGMTNLIPNEYMKKAKIPYTGIKAFQTLHPNQYGGFYKKQGGSLDEYQDAGSTGVRPIQDNTRVVQTNFPKNLDELKVEQKKEINYQARKQAEQLLAANNAKNKEALYQKDLKEGNVPWYEKRASFANNTPKEQVGIKGELAKLQTIKNQRSTQEKLDDASLDVLTSVVPELPLLKYLKPAASLNKGSKLLKAAPENAFTYRGVVEPFEGATQLVRDEADAYYNFLQGRQNPYLAGQWRNEYKEFKKQYPVTSKSSTGIIEKPSDPEYYKNFLVNGKPIQEKPSWLLHEPQSNTLQIKSTMTGSPLEKQLSKTGEINVNNIKTHIGKAEVGQQDKFIVDKVLNEKFAGKTKIDYNDFRKAVSEELVPLEKSFDDAYSKYGVDKLGYNNKEKTILETSLNYDKKAVEQTNKTIKDLEKYENNPEGFLELYKETEYASTPINEVKRHIAETLEHERGRLNTLKNQVLEKESSFKNMPIENTSIVYGNKSKFGKGSIDHFADEGTLGHARILVSKEEPDVMHVLEQQSDFYQKKGQGKTILEKLKGDKTNNTLSREQELIDRAKSRLEENKKILKNLKYKKDNNLLHNGNNVHDSEISQLQGMVDGEQKAVSLREGNLKNWEQKEFLGKNHQERLLQENMLHAAEQGKSKMRYPTSETAAKIQGYVKLSKQRRVALEGELNEVPAEIHFNENGNMQDYYEGDDYLGIHKTILKKYDDTPKMIKKVLGKEAKVVTDPKGNTWYEFDIPDAAKKGKFEIKAFALGGGWLDDEEFRRGGQKGLKKYTSKNIQSSVNDIMLRNETLFGPAGKRRYKPGLKYKDGGWLDNMY